MKDKTIQPIYARVALDIATRISRGELKVNNKIYGRSIISSEYGVSPETIRKSFKLLADMEIVEIQANSGVIIRSREKAENYITRFGEFADIKSIYQKITELISQQEAANQSIKDLARNMYEANRKMSSTYPFPCFEVEVPENSPVSGQSLSDLKFWQQTKATIIFLRRGEYVILSPGPYAVLTEKDIIVFVGDIGSLDAVTSLLCQTSF